MGFHCPGVNFPPVLESLVAGSTDSLTAHAGDVAVVIVHSPVEVYITNLLKVIIDADN